MNRLQTAAQRVIDVARRGEHSTAMATALGNLEIALTASRVETHIADCEARSPTKIHEPDAKVCPCARCTLARIDEAARDRCPSCASTDFKIRQQGKSPKGATITRYQCMACGKAWSETES